MDDGRQTCACSDDLIPLQGILDNTDPRAVRRNVAVRCILPALCITTGSVGLPVHPSVALPEMLWHTADPADCLLQD